MIKNELRLGDQREVDIYRFESSEDCACEDLLDRYPQHLFSFSIILQITGKDFDIGDLIVFEFGSQLPFYANDKSYLSTHLIPLIGQHATFYFDTLMIIPTPNGWFNIGGLFQYADADDFNVIFYSTPDENNIRDYITPNTGSTGWLRH